jgi:hypothetical protein
VLLTPYSTVQDTLGLRRFLTPEVAPSIQVGQRFHMDADRLIGFEFRAAAVAPVGGAFDLTLRDIRVPSIERRVSVRAGELVREGSYVFWFEPVENSADRLFEFTVSSSPEDPGHGVALRATKGDRTKNGGLMINDSLRWASLAFETHTTAEAPLWLLLRERHPDQPPRWLALTTWLVSWIVLRFVLRAASASIHHTAVASSPRNS